LNYHILQNTTPVLSHRGLLPLLNIIANAFTWKAQYDVTLEVMVISRVGPFEAEVSLTEKKAKEDYYLN